MLLATGSAGALALGLAGAVAADGGSDLNAAAPFTETPPARPSSTERPSATAVRGDECGPGQIAGASIGELDPGALNADLPPRTPEKAVAQAYARNKQLKTNPPLHFELGEKSGENSATFVGREPDGQFRASFNVRRGDRGRWLVNGSVVCGDLPRYYTPQPAQIFS